MTRDHTGLAAQLAAEGYCILPAVFSAADIARFRETVLAAGHLMGHTRSVAHALHLAGFHRFPALASLHDELSGNAAVNAFLEAYYEAAPFQPIHLTDITVNRSQQWHTDLLRGPFSHFLPDGLAWRAGEAACIKVLVYLQPGRSLKIVPGSHRTETPLDDAALDRLAQAAPVTQLEVQAGDVVMLDIRALHRGSTDEDMQSPALATNPKILVSTVFGATHSAFAQAMQAGNAARLQEWDRKYLA